MEKLQDGKDLFFIFDHSELLSSTISSITGTQLEKILRASFANVAFSVLSIKSAIHPIIEGYQSRKAQTQEPKIDLKELWKDRMQHFWELLKKEDDLVKYINHTPLTIGCLALSDYPKKFDGKNKESFFEADQKIVEELKKYTSRYPDEEKKRYESMGIGGPEARGVLQVLNGYNYYLELVLYLIFQSPPWYGTGVVNQDSVRLARVVEGALKDAGIWIA